MAAQLEHIKWIPGTRFIVDGFRFPSSDCQHYFLTHAHADHTTGLTKSWNAGTIYCTPVTAKLITEEQSIPKSLVSVVPLNESFWLEGVRITPICANHCPGACMLLFQIPLRNPNGDKTFHSILHTGDFRCAAQPTYMLSRLFSQSAVHGSVNSVDCCQVQIINSSHDVCVLRLPRMKKSSNRS
jgi:DNA cross-link repair 1A protein